MRMSLSFTSPVPIGHPRVECSPCPCLKFVVAFSCVFDCVVSACAPDVPTDYLPVFSSWYVLRCLHRTNRLRTSRACNSVHSVSTGLVRNLTVSEPTKVEGLLDALDPRVCRQYVVDSSSSFIGKGTRRSPPHRTRWIHSKMNVFSLVVILRPIFVLSVSRNRQETEIVFTYVFF